MKKQKEITLLEFKRSNKVRREYLANKAGMTVEEYRNMLELKHLQHKVELSKELFEIAMEEHIEKEKPTIHNVIILDGSGSMDGTKFYNSLRGIDKELQHMVSDTSVNWTSTIHKFSGYNHIVSEPHFMNKQFTNNVNLGEANGGTPLYKTIIDVINRVDNNIRTNDKVLVKIYTDGEDTRGGLQQCRDFIKSLDKNIYTITFVGTQHDVKNIIKNLDLEESNTLVISNDGVGFEKAFQTSLQATKTYTDKVVKGEDVSTGFYLKFN